MTKSLRTGAPCTDPSHEPRDRRARSVGRVAAAALATILIATIASTGCITVDIAGNKDAAIPEERFHALDAADLGASGATTGATRAGSATSASGGTSGPSGPSDASAPATLRRPVIAVRSFRARDRFGKHVVRRDDAGRITPLDHEIWADEPSQAVSDAVREALAATGKFAAAVDPSDAHESDYVLSGTLLEFAVVLPRGSSERTDAQQATSPGASGGAAKALLRARMTVADSRSGRVRATGAYSGEADLPGATAAGLGPAMSRALGQAIRALLADLETARAAESGPGFRISDALDK